jgi:hypothetical protein
MYIPPSFEPDHTSALCASLVLVDRCGVISANARKSSSYIVPGKWFFGSRTFAVTDHLQPSGEFPGNLEISRHLFEEKCKTLSFSNY